MLIEVDDNKNPISSTINQLSGRKLSVSETRSKTHPFRSIPSYGSKFSKALQEFLVELENEEKEPGDLSENKSIPQAFEVLLYRTAELLEVYESLPNIINFCPNRTFKQISQSYRTSVRKTTNDWKFICNAVKHNSNAIYPVKHSIIRSPISIYGYSLCEPKAGAEMAINKNFHRNNERWRSYTITLNQIIFSVLRCDQLAANVIKSMPDQNCEELPVHHMIFDISEVLGVLSRRSCQIIKGQGSIFNGVCLCADGLLLQKRHAEIVRGDARVQIAHTADGFTRIFPLS